MYISVCLNNLVSTLMRFPVSFCQFIFCVPALCCFIMLCVSVYIEIRAANMMILSFTTVSSSVYFLHQIVVYMYLLSHNKVCIAGCKIITNVPTLIFLVPTLYHSGKIFNGILTRIFELHSTAGAPSYFCRKLINICVLNICF